MSVIIKAGSFCPICRGMVLQDCKHEPHEFSVSIVHRVSPEASKEILRLRKALYMCAAHCQGGHSGAGGEASEVLGVPFPIRMPQLEAAAIRDGFDPDELWPWLRPMREGRAL